MGSLFSSPHTKEEIEMALAKAKQIVSSNPVVIFSKTWCGYSSRVKQLLSQLKATHKAVELDEESELAVLAKHQQGKLVPMLAECGAIPKQTTQA